MNASGLVTLLTDFGLTDPYVGVMKGVLWSHFPAARIVDLSHGIPAQDRRAAAFWIERTQRWFEPGSVHVVVVDPGVGTERAILVVEAHEQCFVAPDNGVLSLLLAGAPSARVHALDLGQARLPTPSRTFHGRDVFAPIAALLASGSVRPEELGPPCEPERLADLRWAEHVAESVHGLVVTLDHFGNALTNIRDLDLDPNRSWQVEVAGRELDLVGTYAEAPDAGACALFGSFGVLEIAVRGGSARSRLGLEPGQPVRVCERAGGSLGAAARARP